MSQQFYDLNADAPVVVARPLFGDDRGLIRAAFVLGVVMTAWRLFMIFNTNLMWDEAHFWVSGQHLALGYPDIPPGFPWLARLLTSVAWSVVPLRLFALVIAIAMPFAVHFMALPVTTRRNAVWAAILSMLAPAIALNGTLFYPEGLIQLLLALMCGCWLRAVASDNLKWWLLTGLCAAAGLLTHFRFLVPGLGLFLYLVATSQGRSLWRRRGLYVVAGLAVIGLLPSLIYNATNGWPALAFHAGRQKFGIHPDFIVSFLVIQVAVMTPVFLPAAAAGCWKALRQPETKGAALAWIATTVFVLYVVLALVDKRVMPHWAWMALVPALAFVPERLQAFVAAARTTGGSRLRAGLVALGPILGIATGLGVSAVGYITAHADSVPYQALQAAADTNEDWSRLKPAIRRAEERSWQRYGTGTFLAVGGHRATSRIEVIEHRWAFSMAEPYDDVSRFVIARRLWQHDYAGLLKFGHQGVVLILAEPKSLYNDPEELAFYQRLCGEFDGIEPSSEVDLPPGRVQVHIYTAAVRPLSSQAVTPNNCPLLPALYIAKPTPGVFISANDHKAYFGMATDAKGLTKVDVLIDHKLAVPTQYGLDPAGARAPQTLAYDPNYPKVQFSFQFPDGALRPGVHTLSLRANRSDGSIVEGATQTLYVK